MKTKQITIIAFAAVFATMAPGEAQAAGPRKSRLIKQASVMRSEAEKIALTKVPHGAIQTGDLEKEHGKLVWSFDIARPGTKEITEVHVDAKTGRILLVKNETPAEQAAELQKDKAKR